ncbi:hypothetical protein SNE40_019000 [Patella caerulea]
MGLIRKRAVVNKFQKPIVRKLDENYSFLLIIDFESTCWENRNYRTQEIIEFPAVLLNTSNGKIESEFHYYVQPQEQPTLSTFCKELTGITQEQVDEGIPLSLCLTKFTYWIENLEREKNIMFVKSEYVPKGVNAGTIVTWSDWDLNVCLLYEAKRKQIRTPYQLNSWIDLRLAYKVFYQRKPKGLNGALEDVGIIFEGRQHSGLHDSRNTARLAWRMIRDGYKMEVTKSLHGTSTKNTCQPTITEQFKIKKLVDSQKKRSKEELKENPQKKWKESTTPTKIILSHTSTSLTNPKMKPENGFKSPGLSVRDQNIKANSSPSKTINQNNISKSIICPQTFTAKSYPQSFNENMNNNLKNKENLKKTKSFSGNQLKFICDQRSNEKSNVQSASVQNDKTSNVISVNDKALSKSVHFGQKTLVEEKPDDSSNPCTLTDISKKMVTKPTYCQKSTLCTKLTAPGDSLRSAGNQKSYYSNKSGQNSIHSSSVKHGDEKYKSYPMYGQKPYQTVKSEPNGKVACNLKDKGTLTNKAIKGNALNISQNLQKPPPKTRVMMYSSTNIQKQQFKGGSNEADKLDDTKTRSVPSKPPKNPILSIDGQSPKKNLNRISSVITNQETKMKSVLHPVSQTNSILPKIQVNSGNHSCNLQEKSNLLVTADDPPKSAPVNKCKQTSHFPDNRRVKSLNSSNKFGQNANTSSNKFCVNESTLGKERLNKTVQPANISTNKSVQPTNMPANKTAQPTNMPANKIVQPTNMPANKTIQPNKIAQWPVNLVAKSETEPGLPQKKPRQHQIIQASRSMTSPNILPNEFSHRSNILANKFVQRPNFTTLKYLPTSTLTTSKGNTSRVQNTCTLINYGPNDNTKRQRTQSNPSGMMATPPLCNCGRRSKRRMVQNPGPNIGRFFFACRLGSRDDPKVGCGMFQWEKKIDVYNNNKSNSFSS